MSPSSWLPVASLLRPPADTGQAPSLALSHRSRGTGAGDLPTEQGATLTLTHGLAHTVGGSSLSTASRATIQPLGDAETTTAQVQSAPARGTARASGTVEATCGVGDQEPGSGRSEPRCASVRSRCWGSIPFACSCGPFFPTPQQLGPDRVSLGEGLTSGHHLRRVAALLAQPLGPWVPLWVPFSSPQHSICLSRFPPGCARM